MVDNPWSIVSIGHALRLFGIFLAIAGVIISIVGAVEKERPKKQ